MTNPAPKQQKIVAMAGSPAGGYSLGRKIAQTNRWREQYNPLRGLTIARAVSQLEGFFRGEMADLQWTYFFVEQTDPDLYALVDRRTSAIGSLDWDIKIQPKRRRRRDFDEVLAEEEAAALREAYDRIDNFQEAVEHCAMATFRGFAHLEKHRAADGTLLHLEPLDQWNVVRDGLRGPWKYNPEARSTTFQGLPDEYLLDPADWIIREPKRHINRIGLVKFVRQNLSQKDWDAFIEIYGIPGVIIIGPPNIPTEKEAEYQSAAKDVAEGGSGYLPNGSDAKPVEGPRGVNPFRDHLKWLQEQLILAGTGGLLTMLTQSGSGTLAGSAHQETFDLIARSEAQKISESFQRGLDMEILEPAFPGRPRLAYFDLSGGDQVDPSDVIDQVAKLAVAGYRVDEEEVSEKTGYKLQSTEQGAGSGDEEHGGPRTEDKVPADPVLNRQSTADRQDTVEELLGNARGQFAQAVADDLQPLRKRLERILQIEDPEILAAKLQAFQAELPRLAKDMLADPGAAESIAETMTAAVFHGMVEGAQSRPQSGARSTLRNAGSSEGAKKGWETRKTGGTSSGTPTEQLKDVMAGRSDEAAYADVSPEIAAKIKAATGRDVSGFRHFIDRDALIHIHRGHGVGKEREPENEPVTANDIERIPEIVTKPDRIVGGKTARGLPAVRYEKRYNGTTYYVEEEWTQDGLLAAKTMYKKKALRNSATPEGGFSHTSKTFSAPTT